MFVISTASFILSAVLSAAIVILSSEKLILRYPSIIKKLKNSFIVFLLVLALFVYRYLCNIPKITYNTYIFGNMGIIMSFYFLRFHYITVLASSKIDLVMFSTMFLISTIFGTSRLFFRSGFIINEKLIIKPEISFILESLQKPGASFFISLGKRLAGNMPPNPGSTGVDRHYALGLGTFCATAIGASSGVYLGYEAYQSRQINIRATKIAEHSANIAERALDIQERNSSNMSKETFDKKWDEFGNKRVK